LRACPLSENGSDQIIDNRSFGPYHRPMTKSKTPSKTMLKHDVAALERDLLSKCPRMPTGTGRVFTSGGRRYVFYWLKIGRRLAVNVSRREPLERLPAVEALAEKILASWSCPICGKTFPRRGKQRYCSPAHAALARKERWRARRKNQTLREYRADLRARHFALDRAKQRPRLVGRVTTADQFLDVSNRGDGRGAYWGV
jgi:hypothetical protein